MIARIAAALLAWLCLLAGPAQAHKPSDSYLSIVAATGTPGAPITGRWDIALRDLDFAIGLDADGDGRITWGELRARHADIAAFAQSRLALRLDGAACTLAIGAQQVDTHTDGAYTVMPLRWDCPAAPGRQPATLEIEYRLFADIDPQHRGLLNLNVDGAARAAVLGPQAPVQAFALAGSSGWSAFSSYAREGVWHIWVGFDHILFLLSLLLPAVLVWRAAADTSGVGPAGWVPVPRLRPALWDVLRIVTAFTLAHSITLSLATLGWLTPPSRLVESVIAASVVLAALNNVWPLFQRRRWAVAFGFGLVHGFGFASVLSDLGLPQGALALALLGFNVGVEIGQLAIVAVFLPLAFALRRTVFYRRGVLVGGSLAIAALAAVWFAERAFKLKVLPF